MTWCGCATQEGVAAKPSPEQIVAMKTAGVSDRVIEEMLAARVPAVAALERPTIYYRYEYTQGGIIIPGGMGGHIHTGTSTSTGAIGISLTAYRDVYRT